MRYRIDPANVSHERLQDEVIIISLARGAYYAGSGSAADVWTAIASGATVDETASLLAGLYGTDREVVRRDVADCVEKLVELAVIVPDGNDGVGEAVRLPDVSRTSWTAPIFDEYTDMWDLLKADPIHDVGDAGWPYAIPQSKI